MPARIMLKEVRMHPLQLGLDKDNNGAFSFRDFVLIYILREKVVSSKHSGVAMSVTQDLGSCRCPNSGG